MKINTLGSQGNPAVILIHGMFCDYTSTLTYAEHLKGHYFVIMPTLDGHYAGSGNYTTADGQAKKLTVMLHEMDISEIALLQGTSMGAEVALAVTKICDIPIRHYLFDGGPFFMFPKWFRGVMQRKFEGFTRKFKGKSRETVMQDSFIRWIGGKNLNDYGSMLDSFIKSADFMTAESIKNVTETCYCCTLPMFSEQLQKKFVFHFSEKEPAHQSKKRLQKAYPYAKYIDYPGNGHCGFQAAEPEKYAEFLISLMR